jgi:hypothetical protein
MKLAGAALSLMVVVSLGVPCAASAGTTINVTTQMDTTGSCPGASCSLRDAVSYADAHAGTTIEVPAGSYDLSHGELQITAPMTISGQGATASDTKIVQQANSGNRVLDIVLPSAGQVTIADLEITGGNENQTVTVPPESFGGGILFDDTVSGVALQLTDDLIDHNTVTGETQAGTGKNGGDANGGGIAVTHQSGDGQGTLTLSNTVVSSNTAEGGDGTSSSTGAGGYGGDAIGGGVYDGSNSTLVINDGSRIESNQAIGGAGKSGAAGFWAGGGGSAWGAGMFTSAHSTIDAASIADNTATGGAGSSAVSGQTNGNGGAGLGGGIYVYGIETATLTAVTIHANRATPGANGTGGTPGAGGLAAGAGLLTNATSTTIEQSTIDANTATAPSGSVATGGAFDVRQPTTIVNSTLNGNSALAQSGAKSAKGGAIYAEGATFLSADTIDGNRGDTAGANIFTIAPVRSQATAVVLPADGGINCESQGNGNFADGKLPGGNFEDDPAASCGFAPGLGDTVGGPPLLTPLSNNGGPTLTMLPQPHSPLLGAGRGCLDPAQSAPLHVDQRGLPRPSDVACDVGAVQIQAPTNTSAPSVSPRQVVVSHPVTCNPGHWSADGTLSYAYAWQRDGSTIAGQSSASYAPVAGDLGHSITCSVTATSSYGRTGGPISSGAVSVVRTPPPRISHLRESHRKWRETAGHPRSGPPIGTTFSFTLSKPARITLAFTRLVVGHTVHGKCVRAGSKSSSGHRCMLGFPAGKLFFSGAAGPDKIRFAGVLSPRRRLARGRYSVAFTVQGAPENAGGAKFLTFTIARG